MNESSVSDFFQFSNTESIVDSYSLDFEIVLENNIGIVLVESFYSEQGLSEGFMYLGGYNYKKMFVFFFYFNVSTDTLENRSEFYDSYKFNFFDFGFYGS